METKKVLPVLDHSSGPDDHNNNLCRQMIGESSHGCCATATTNYSERNQYQFLRYGGESSIQACRARSKPLWPTIQHRIQNNIRSEPPGFPLEVFRG